MILTSNKEYKEFYSSNGTKTFLQVNTYKDTFNALKDVVTGLKVVNHKDQQELFKIELGNNWASMEVIKNNIESIVFYLINCKHDKKHIHEFLYNAISDNKYIGLKIACKNLKTEIDLRASSELYNIKRIELDKLKNKVIEKVDQINKSGLKVRLNFYNSNNKSNYIYSSDFQKVWELGTDENIMYNEMLQVLEDHVISIAS